MPVVFDIFDRDIEKKSPVGPNDIAPRIVQNVWGRPAKSAWPEAVGLGRQAHGPLRGLRYALRGARVARWMDDASFMMMHHGECEARDARRGMRAARPPSGVRCMVRDARCMVHGA